MVFFLVDFYCFLLFFSDGFVVGFWLLKCGLEIELGIMEFYYVVIYGGFWGGRQEWRDVLGYEGVYKIEIFKD